MTREEILKELNLDLLDHDKNPSAEIGMMFNHLAESIDNVIELRAGKQNLKEWVEKYRVLFGKPFRYNDAGARMMLGEKDKEIKEAPRPYLDKYLADRCIEKSVIKCRQSEFSENEINENLYLCCNIDYFRVVHLFPTGRAKDTMCKEKIDPAIKFSPNINMLLAPKKSQSLSVKLFNNGSIYRTESSWTETGGRGPSCDKITFDEYESQKPDIEEIYSESTSHSRYGRRSRISTPLVPNMGIDKKFREGCRFEWVVTCPKCKKEQILKFPENIINFFDKEGDYLIDDKKYIDSLNKVYIGCKYCGTYIDRTSDFYIKTSKWIADKPAMISVHNSYHVSYFMLPWKTGKEILYKYHSFQFYHQFQNEILGVAYVAEDSNIGRAILEANINPMIVSDGKFYGFYKNISIGVDWGGGKIGSWVVIKCQGHPESKKEAQIIYIEKITKESLKKLGYSDTTDDGHKYRVEHLIEIFKANICVNDANGIGNDRNQYLIRKFPGKVFGAFYDTADNQKQKTKSKLIEPQWNDNKSIVTVSRLLEFKAILQQFRDLNKIDLPIQTEDVREFIDHLNNIIIEKMYDQKTATVYEIVASMGADHYAHAYLYANVGYLKITSNSGAAFLGGFG